MIAAREADASVLHLRRTWPANLRVPRQRHDCQAEIRVGMIHARNTVIVTAARDRFADRRGPLHRLFLPGQLRHSIMVCVLAVP
jgi:hypothetical protein